MLAILYLCLTIAFGISLISVCVNTSAIYETIAGEEFSKKVPKLLFIIPAGITVGIMTVTFVNYWIIYILDLIKYNNNVNYPIGIILTFCIFIGLTVFNFYKIRKKKEETRKYKKGDLIYYVLILLILVIIISFLMFYACRIKNNSLLIGVTVDGDLAPHTAMISSFAVGGNIPTQYMHFAGDGIQWHFFFYFFAGLLEYLGLPIDFALNIPSILVMSVALTLVGLIASLLAKNKIPFVIGPILILFRSSFNIFFQIKKLIDDNVPIIEGIIKSNIWTSVTPYDNYAIWTINTLANQRHLMLGMSVILISIILFMPYIKDMLDTLKKYKLKEKIKYFFISKEAWKINFEDKRLLIAILLVIQLPYFHGSSLIAGLLILCCFAIFSKSRLSYLVIAVLAIVSSVIQTNIFSGGASNAIKFTLKMGFVLGKTNFVEIVKYIFMITGVVSIISLLNIVVNKKDKLLYCILWISFITPFCFAFLFQLTVDILTNHKFIQFSIILLDIFVAEIVGKLLSCTNKKIIKRCIGILLIVLLTITGVSEWFTFCNMNKNYYYVNTKSEIVAWIKNNTDKDDIFLTPRWTLHEFFLSGRGVFFGWPTFAMSAGHDTYGRGNVYVELLKGANKNKEKFVEICKKYHIKYIYEDEDLIGTRDDRTSKLIYDKEFIKKNFELMLEKRNGRYNVHIYKIYD